MLQLLTLPHSKQPFHDMHVSICGCVIFVLCFSAVWRHTPPLGSAMWFQRGDRCPLQIWWWYQCSKCGKLTARNLKEWSPFLCVWAGQYGEDYICPPCFAGDLNGCIFQPVRYIRSMYFNLCLLVFVLVYEKRSAWHVGKVNASCCGC